MSVLSSRYFVNHKCLILGICKSRICRLFLAPLGLILLVACTSSPPMATENTNSLPPLPEGIRVISLQNLNPELAQVKQDLGNHSQILEAKSWENWVSQRGGNLPLRSGNQTLFLFHPIPGTDSVELNLSIQESFLRLPMEPLGYSGIYALGLEGLPQDYNYGFLLSSGDSISRSIDPFGFEVLGGKALLSRVRTPAATHGRLIYHSPNELPPSKAGLAPRGVFVYLPPGYDPSGSTRYPVMYWGDGQGLWDNPDNPYGGWKLDTISDRLILEGQIPAMIHVGITYGVQRMKEYMGYGVVHKTTGLVDKKNETQFTLLKNWLVDDLKPWIDKSYPTNPAPRTTALGGSSAGGAWATSLALMKPDTLGRAAGFSVAISREPGKEVANPEFGVNLVARLHTVLFRDYVLNKPPVRIWLDCGTQGLDESLLWGAEAFRDGLVNLGYKQQSDMNYQVVQDGNHTERDWSTRLSQVLVWLWE